MANPYLFTGEQLDCKTGYNAVSVMLECVNEVADLDGGTIDDPEEYLENDTLRNRMHYILVESGVIVAVAGVEHGVIDEDNYDGGVFETRGHTLAVPKLYRGEGFGSEMMRLIEGQAIEHGDRYHNFRSLDQPRAIYEHLGYNEWRDWWFVKDLQQA